MVVRYDYTRPSGEKFAYLLCDLLDQTLADQHTITSRAKAEANVRNSSLYCVGSQCFLPTGSVDVS
jgi:hypothetical protein